MRITSSVFTQGEQIPSHYTCDGEDVSPPLEIWDVPPRTRSVALLVDDIDVSNGTPTWVHWVMWNIHPHTTDIKAGHVPKGAVQGKTSFETNHYVGPCPMKGKHHYRFRVFALTKEISCSPECTMEDVEEEMTGHIINEAELVGTYRRE